MMKKLIFAYNADSGIVPGIIDTIHKFVKPETYQCNLCGITYGVTGMKKEWKAFIKSLNVSVEFLHRDEFALEYGVTNVELPAAFLKKEKIELLISAEEMNSCENVEDLKDLVTKKLLPHQNI